jgi:oligosaccharyl transferase (archaeosortase A-associated)
MKRVSMNTRIKKIEKTSLICGTILAFIFFLALCIRTAIPYNSVFTGSFVRFGGNDPWYNMRLVENTLYHFPHRIYFDSFTAYPHGTYNPFGTPLFDQSLAFIIWVIGLGNPASTLGQHGIEVIGAWYPAVLGALTVFPVYFIGKGLYNRSAGLFSAALIAILPGPFLARSLLGFTDHHAMETFFSTIAMLFFILAVKSAREKKITFYSILRKDWSSLKKPVFYSSLAGISIGSYFLAWVGAPLFIFILLIYALVQHIADHLRGKDTDYLCIVSMPAFIIPLAMIAPVHYSYGFLSEFHIISLFLGIIVFLFLSGFSASLKAKKIRPYGYPIAILVLSIIFFLVLRVLNPSLYSTLTRPLLYVFTPSKSYLTIAEVQPMGLDEIWSWFSITFFLAFAALAWIGYNISRKWRAEEILFVVWSAVMLFACFGQNRFAAYYAVNVAVLCGFISWKIIEFVGFGGEEKGVRERRIKKAREELKEKRSRKTKFEGAKVEKKKENDKMKRYLRAENIIAFLIFGFVGFGVFYPALSTSLTGAKNPGGLIPGPEYDWYESLSWMRQNTPDPSIDYYALYDKPPQGEDYKYPESAYSIMSWWDYGHWITRIAHRVPAANNFQKGIGGPYQGDNPGACVFFTTNNETQANKVVDALDVRYVVSDFRMADIWNALYNKFSVMTVWAGDTEGYYVTVEREARHEVMPSAKYYNTMEARLHMFDGTSTNIRISKNETIPALRHYRLVHESPLYILLFTIIDTESGSILYTQYSGTDYQSVKAEAQNLHRGARMEGQPEKIKRTPEFIQPVSFVKVFEYVKGARIEGRVPNASIVVIATNITTNQGREFIYSQRTISNDNGSYGFIVPYSTEGPIEGGTNFDVLAAPYKIRMGHIENETMTWDTEKDVEVDEKKVMEGKTIRVDLV